MSKENDALIVDLQRTAIQSITNQATSSSDLMVGYLCVFEQPHPQWPNRRGVYCYEQIVIIPREVPHDRDD